MGKKLKVNGQKFKVGDKVLVAAWGVVTRAPWDDEVTYVTFEDGLTYEGPELEDMGAAIVKVV